MLELVSHSDRNAEARAVIRNGHSRRTLAAPRRHAPRVVTAPKGRQRDFQHRSAHTRCRPFGAVHILDTRFRGLTPSAKCFHPFGAMRFEGAGFGMKPWGPASD